ncbi:hypothetical protein [Nostoc sp. ChiQUE01b]|uniref:hypothetical protein n=1 Tax=Nostoc sp. ChiQUE01b TaxID=3075376 RepID=UPI002AD52200|nr:hypothetical protein [Nostoc sp. ChiQUE01b]MDZ8261945.1 hypothetical protein [Nostoc sp. ChiQUE01b]
MVTAVEPAQSSINEPPSVKFGNQWFPFAPSTLRHHLKIAIANCKRRLLIGSGGGDLLQWVGRLKEAIALVQNSDFSFYV